MSHYILSVDQGTTATKALLINPDGRIAASAQAELAQVYPRPGWVEMDPKAIWRSILDTTSRALDAACVQPEQIAAIGLANQGETVVAWDRETGEPLYNAITWQCTRTADRCARLAASADSEAIRAKTGLVLDAYFSASKWQWLLENVPAVREAWARRTLLLGTLDAWMIWQMSGGRFFITDYSTASRTLLFNVHSLSWDDELLRLFGIPRWALPEPAPSAGHLGETDPRFFLGLRVPICGSAVDQPAALFGQRCFSEGQLKITYGTGAFLLMNIGSRFRLSRNGLLTSIAAAVNGEEVSYYLDGGIYSVGAALRWLQEGLGLVAEAKETGKIAASLQDNGGVYFVPALVGLAAPHWRRDVQAAFLGMTPATTRAHLVRAVLEAIAFRVMEVVRAMEADAGLNIEAIKVDGGVAQNDFLMQFQADLLGIPLQRTRASEMTALGVAYLAGLGSGLWTRETLPQLEHADVFLPNVANGAPLAAFQRWQGAVQAAKLFAS